MRKIMLAFGCLLALAACSATDQAKIASINTQIVAGLPTAQQNAQAAIKLYGIAKGMAGVASLVDPAIAPEIALTIAVTDPLVAKAQLALNDTVTDAPALTALAAQITAQANALTTKAAPSIVVVAGKPAA